MSRPKTSHPAPTTTTNPADQRSLLREAFLHDLTHAERLLLLLRYAESMTVAEVALIMGITHDDVVATQERLVSRLGSHLRAA